MDPQAQVRRLVTAAERALKRARGVEPCRQARELATAAQHYAESVKADPEVLQRIACLAIEAEHALGSALAAAGLAKGVPGNQHTGKKLVESSRPTRPKYLRDYGISKELSCRSQLLALAAHDVLRTWMLDQCQQGKQPTLKGAVQFVRRLRGEAAGPAKRAPRKRPTPAGGPLSALQEHYKSLDNLLRDHYDGSTQNFTKSKGRMLKQIMKEMDAAIREIKPMRPNDGGQLT